LKLNIGCGKNHLKDFINVDKFINNKPDVLCDLEFGLPFKDNSIDEIFGIHIMEHISNLIILMRDIYRVCKNGAKCFFVTPYVTSYDAWESPFHVRTFNENTWHYFNPKLYEQPGHAGYADHGVDFNFQVIECFLIPYPEFLNDPELEFKKQHWNNIIREIQIRLEVVK